MGFVPACFEVVPYSRKETIQSDGFDGLKCLTVDPSRTTVPLGYTVGLFEGLLRVTWTKMPQKRCAFSDFAFQYIRRRSSCNAMGAFVISPLALLGQTEFLIGPGPSLRARFAARPSAVPYDPIDSLTPTLPFPTHGYRKCLFGGISPAGRRGSLQLTRCRSHHVAADTPPVRTAVSDSFRRPLLPSRVIDRLGHRLIV